MALYRSWNKQLNHFTYFKNGRYFIQRHLEKHQEQCLVCVEQYFGWDNAEQYSDVKDIDGTPIYAGDTVYIAGYGNYEAEFPFTELYEAMAENDIGRIIGNIHQGIAVESGKENTV